MQRWSNAHNKSRVFLDKYRRVHVHYAIMCIVQIGLAKKSTYFVNRFMGDPSYTVIGACHVFIFLTLLTRHLFKRKTILGKNVFAKFQEIRFFSKISYKKNVGR